MNRRLRLFFVSLISTAISLLIVNKSLASPEGLTRGVVYDQRIGDRVSTALTFFDEQGRETRLDDYFGRRPVVLLVGYYGCPVLCGVSLNALTQAIEEFPPESVSRDFEFIFVSIDPKEGFLVAAEKKKECLRRVGSSPAASRWHFLTGAQSAAALADQVGFHFRYDTQSRQYIHPSGLVILSADGKITSYLLGIDYPAARFEQALTSARRDETGGIAKTTSILCFSNDQVVGSTAYYVLLALRFGALVTVCGLILIIRMKLQRFANKSQ
jgi:protein SCO1